jgi:hypothetical protein
MSPSKWFLKLLLLTAAIAIGDTGAKAAELKLPFSGGKCFDMSEGSTSNGGRVVQFTCFGQSNQKWDMNPTDVADEYQIVNQNSGKCLEISEAQVTANAWAQQWDCNGRPHQKFRLSETGSAWNGLRIFTFRPVHSGLCLTVLGGTIADGAQIIQFDCNGGTNQQIVWVQ